LPMKETTPTKLLGYQAGLITSSKAVVELRGGSCVTGAPEMAPQTARVCTGWFGAPLGPHRLQSLCGALGQSTDVPGGGSRGLLLRPGARVMRMCCAFNEDWDPDSCL
jgi:hypothetical protein